MRLSKIFGRNRPQTSAPASQRDSNATSVDLRELSTAELRQVVGGLLNLDGTHNTATSSPSLLQVDGTH